jgi:hypothetical protein
MGERDQYELRIEKNRIKYHNEYFDGENLENQHFTNRNIYNKNEPKFGMVIFCQNWRDGSGEQRIFCQNWRCNHYFL